MAQSTYVTPDLARSALLTIDMQRDFSTPGSPAYVEGTEAAIRPLEQLLDAFRACRRPIVHVVRLYRRDGSNVDLCRRAEIENGKRVVAPETEGAELVHELYPDAESPLDASTLLDGRLQRLGEHEWAMYKPRWGPFFQTPLDEFLRARNLNTIVIAGCNFPNCPRTTVYEASERDYRIVLVPQAVSQTYDRGLKELENIGVQLMEVADCVNELDRASEPQSTADPERPL